MEWMPNTMHQCNVWERKGKKIHVKIKLTSELVFVHFLITVWWIEQPVLMPFFGCVTFSCALGSVFTQVICQSLHQTKFCNWHVCFHSSRMFCRKHNAFECLHFHADVMFVNRCDKSLALDTLYQIIQAILKQINVRTVSR